MQRPRWLPSNHHDLHSMAQSRSLNLRKPWLILTTIFLCFAVPLLLFKSAPFEHLNSWLNSSTRPPAGQPEKPDKPKKVEGPAILPPPPPEVAGFYDWQTSSSFNPVRQPDVSSKSVQDICASFPSHLLKDIQPVLKTGHGVLEARVGPQLLSMSACLVNLLIVSDAEEHFEGQQTIDIIEDIPAHLRDNEQQLDAWRNGSIIDGTATIKQAWRLDKFKFLPAVSRAWRMRPDRKWYVFYEADTYVVWDNLFRWVEHFDPDEPHYFGSPSPGRRDTWFANGGPGYILSREAVRRLVKEDWNAETGEYVGSKLTERCWDDVHGNCCGDSVLGWALILQNITLSGLFPMMTPHAPHGLPFSGQKKHWCQPLLTMHKPAEEDILGLWRWQWEHRERDVSIHSNPRVYHSPLIFMAATFTLPRPRAILLQLHRATRPPRLECRPMGQLSRVRRPPRERTQIDRRVQHGLRSTQRVLLLDLPPEAMLVQPGSTVRTGERAKQRECQKAWEASG